MKSTRTFFKLFLLLFVLFVTSCKKENVKPKDEKPSSNEYYVTFKVDGVKKTFAGSATSFVFDGVRSDQIRQYNVLFDGEDKYLDTTKNFLGVIMADFKEIKANKWYTNSFKGMNGAEMPELFSLIYKDENGKYHSSLGDNVTSLIGINSDGHIRFSEITPTYIKGTFSATVYDDDHIKTKKITDGEFRAKRIL